MTQAIVDMSNQVNNSWTKNTVLALACANLRSSVIIEVNNKSRIRKFCEEQTNLEANKSKDHKRIKKLEKRYFNRSVSIVHAYLLYKLLSINKNGLNSTEIAVCRDTMAKHLHNNLQRICQMKGERTILEKLNIEYGLKKNNTVQKYAKSIAKGEGKPSWVITVRETDEIIDFINKFVPKK